MNTKFSLFALIGIFYFSLMPMNKQKVVWHTKAVGYSIATAASGALVIYSLIEILNRSPLDTFTSLIVGTHATHDFGKEAYKNIVQAWHGIALKPTPEQAEKIIKLNVERNVQETMQSMASGTSVELDVELIQQSGTSNSSTIGTLRFRPKEPPIGLTQFLDEGNKQREQNLKLN